jgi:citrate lyase beta subunit
MAAFSEETFRKFSATLAAPSNAGADLRCRAAQARQPVHTVYGGAHLFREDTAQKLGAAALNAMRDYAPDPAQFAAAVGVPEELAPKIHSLVQEKLEREPVEDFRLDFEDGYGRRADAEEDGHAQSAAREVARGMAAGKLPPYIGMRIKPLNAELYRRSLRTLEIFLSTLIRHTGRHSSDVLPAHFVVTLPKITSPEQVSVLVDALAVLETSLGLAPESLQIELMIETPQSVFNARGECALAELVAAAHGRCRGAHFGTYDYTAACGITAAHQHMTHLACDFARSVMLVALAGTGIWLSDGATNILPVPLHRASGGQALSAKQTAENRMAVQRAWRLHFAHIQHSLENGFYQGWDLHPAQLVSRYAAVYSFFLAGLDVASERLHNFIRKAAQATLLGEIFDDAATGQGLLNYFLRAIHAGAVSEEEAQKRAGLTLEELRSGSFAKITANRTP